MLKYTLPSSSKRWKETSELLSAFSVEKPEDFIVKKNTLVF